MPLPQVLVLSHCAAGPSPIASTAQHNCAQPSSQQYTTEPQFSRYRGREGGKAKDGERRPKKGWLVGGKERWKKGKGGGYRGFQGRKRRNSGGLKMRCPPPSPCGSHICIHYF